MFLGLWLSSFALTWGALSYQAYYGGYYTASLFQLIVLEVGVLVSWACYWMILYPRYFTPFRNLPTPQKRSILTGNFPELFPNQPWEYVRNIAETTPNDGLIRLYSALSGEVLLVTNPSSIKDFLAAKAFDFGHQELVQLAIKRFTGSNLGFLSTEDFKLHRKNMLPAFAVPHIKQLTHIFWDKALEMVGCIEDELKSNPQAVIELREYVSRATLDNIGLAGMGYDFQTLKQPDNELRHRFRKVILDQTKVFSWVGLLSRYLDMRLLLKMPLKKLREILESSNYLRNVSGRVIQERKYKLQTSESKDLVGKDIVTVALASGVFQESHLVDHVMTFLTAGHESTATAFEWTMYELARQPEMQQRLRAELHEALGSDLAAVDFGPQAQNLPYLNAFCSEVLRCYPFSPIIVKTAQRNTMLNGARVPKGTVVIYSAETTNHDKNLWGPDAHVFNPNRWLGPGMAKTGGATSNYAMLSFGAGPRNCIGQDFARATLHCLVAAMVATFEIELANADTAGRLKFGQTKKSVEGMWARLKIVSRP
ncbi:cytochrome P450 [Hypoxylon rubiginosum]|uniref:Cytochrome P450 n=1 Tax=Hypoxylon rubiginosum TaxID=110542 RepID=A0ACB9Z1I1_9PEZI|nr:cytochrome P450 [Hypoxylon rubiginosum]